MVAQAIERLWPKGSIVSYESWLRFFDEHQPKNTSFSDETIRQYAGNLKSWLLFAGLIELRPRGVSRADGEGAQMGVVGAGKHLAGLFLGAAAPARLVELLVNLYRGTKFDRPSLEADGLRNAIADASALGLVETSTDGIRLRRIWASESALIEFAKVAVLKQPSVQLAFDAIDITRGDREAAGDLVREALGASWKPTSARRVFGGLWRYASWANEKEEPEDAPVQSTLIE